MKYSIVTLPKDYAPEILSPSRDAERHIEELYEVVSKVYGIPVSFLKGQTQVVAK